MKLDSLILHRVPNHTHLPPLFSNVTVSATMYPEDFEADFAVGAPHPIFGAEPRALHSGQCGRAGRGVALPYTAVMEEDGAARRRVGELTKLRT